MSFFRSEHLPAVTFALSLLWHPISVALVDCIIPARLKLKPAREKSIGSPRCDDYTVLIPIFGHIKYLKNVDFLAPYGGKVVFCTTDQETPEFERALQAIADRHGFRIFRSGVAWASGRPKGSPRDNLDVLGPSRPGERYSTWPSSQAGTPNPWKLLSRTLDSRAGTRVTSGTERDRIIRDSFANVRTAFTIFLDGDTVATEELDLLAGAARDGGYDIASVRVLASKTVTLAEKLQAVEYESAMDARRVYPWLTSGACLIGKTRALQSIMHHHSLFFSGGDIEIGKLAKILKYSVGHIPFELYTDVPETLRAWFKQRMAWCGGGFRHAIVNSHRYSWRHPFFYLYTTVIVYALTPLRWYELLTHPQVLLLVIPLYWLLTIAINWGKLHWHLALYPFYSLVQVMVLVPLGIYTYIRMVMHSRNTGRIRLRPRHQAQWGRSTRRLRPTPQLQGQAGR